MKDNRMQKADRYIQESTKRKHWHRIVAALAGLVVVATIYLLTLPGITMDQYTCGKEEHAHTQTCYTHPQETADVETAVESVLSCEKEEHTHSDQCRAENETKEETPAASETLKTPEAATAEPDAQMQVHTVNEGEPVLNIAGDVQEEPLDLSEYIKEGKFSYSTATQGPDIWTEVRPGVQVPGNAKLLLDVTYDKIPLGTLLKNGGRIFYEPLPEIMKAPWADGTITDGQHNEIGTIQVTDRRVEITFKEEWLRGLIQDVTTKISGDFYIRSWIDCSKLPGGGSTSVSLGGVQVDITFEDDLLAKYSDVTIEKSTDGKIVKENGSSYLFYRLDVTAGDTEVPSVTVRDIFTTNKNLIAYENITAEETELPDAPVSGAATAADTPYEILSAMNTSHGTIKTEGDGFLWTIGNMKANEKRTLWYAVKVDRNKKPQGTLNNTAEVYSDKYKKDDAFKNVSLDVQGSMKKTSANPVRQPDGSYIIPYTVYTKINPDSAFTVKNVKIKDTLVKSEEVIKYFTYEENSFQLFKDEKGTQPLSFQPEQLNFTYTKDKKTFTFDVGDLAPGEVRCIKYNVRVQPEAILADYTTGVAVENLAETYGESTDEGTGETLFSAHNQQDITYAASTWLTKKVWAAPVQGEETIEVTGGKFYDLTQSEPVEMSEPDPATFEVPKKSFKYEVILNANGDWDVTKATLTDKLSNDYLAYAGYVRIEAYRPSTPSVSEKKIWAKIEGKTSFTLRLEQLGVEPSTYAYRFTYYAKPANVSNVTTGYVTNTVKLSGQVGLNGSYFPIDRVNISGSQTVGVTGDAYIAMTKEPWYYTKTEVTDSRGAFVWAIRVDGNMVQKGVQFQDSLESGNSRMTFPTDGALAGLYIGHFPAGQKITDFSDVASAEKSGYIRKLNAGEDYSFTRKDKILEIKMLKTHRLDGDDGLYIICRSVPNRLPNDRETIQHENVIRFRGATGGNWNLGGKATQSLTGGDNLMKELIGTFIWKPSANKFQWLNRAKPEGESRIDTNSITSSGTYAAWAVKSNYRGTLSGKYRIVDEVPEGMEAVYARLKWRGNGAVDVRMVRSLDLVRDGWTEWMNRSVDDGGQSIDSYYYTKGNQVCWELEPLSPGNKFDTYSVDVQIVCRITDDGVLLGGETGNYTNKVVMYQEGVEVGTDTSNVTVKVSNIQKNAVLDGSIIPFTLKINESGQDLVKGAQTVTVIDEMSSSLKLDPTTIQVKNSDRPEETVLFRASQDGQKLKIVVPDNIPLTITYSAKVLASPNEHVAISNSAYWEGYDKTAGSSVSRDDYSYSLGGTAGGEKVPYVMIIKYDENNLTSFLSGAAFTMREGRMEDGTFIADSSVREWQGETGPNGRLLFGQESNHHMKFNTVYEIVETKAPTGYVLDKTPFYFIIAEKDASGKYPDYPPGIRVWYTDNIFTYTVPNRKGELAVEKSFADASGRPLGTSIGGVFRFGLFEDPQAETEPIQTVDIDLRNGSGNNKAVFKNLEHGKTYYVFELDDQDKPVKADQSAVIGKNSFVVTYPNGNAAEINVTQGGTDTPSVSVINRINYPELPETGGPGIWNYMLYGAILAVLSGALLFINFIKMKRKNRD